MRTLIVTILLLALQPALADDLYRWVDSAGKVHYGDAPPEDAEKLNLKIFGSPASSVDEASQSYEARRAHEHFPVTLYTADKCGDACNKARDFLNKRHVPFTETVVKTDEELADFKQKSGGNRVPAVTIGKSWIINFQPDQWGEELDTAGYPK